MLDRGTAVRRKNPSTADESYRAINLLVEGLFYKRLDAELNLTGAVLSDHRHLVRIAAEAGVRKHHFARENDDLCIIYGCAVAGRDKARKQVLADAMFSLMNAGYWDGTQIAGNLGQCLWSADSLVALANSRLPSEHDVKRFAQDVIDLHKRAQQARNHHDAMMLALQGSEQTSQYLRRAA